MTTSKKLFVLDYPRGSYLWFKEIEERAQDEAWKEIAAERKAAQAKVVERPPKPIGS